MFQEFLSDLKYGLRTFGKRPLFTIVAIGTLAIGIGATTTMFSVMDRVLLHHLPFPRSTELVTIWKSQPGSSWTAGLRWNEFLAGIRNWNSPAT